MKLDQPVNVCDNAQVPRTPQTSKLWAHCVIQCEIQKLHRFSDAIVIGRYQGRAPPAFGLISFIFMQFRGKLCQIIGCRPHLQGWDRPPPSGKSLIRLFSATTLSDISRRLNLVQNEQRMISLVYQHPHLSFGGNLKSKGNVCEYLAKEISYNFVQTG